jgi:hypothetical protein
MTIDLSLPEQAQQLNPVSGMMMDSHQLWPLAVFRWSNEEFP